jgi:S1-C subfamily serine protease
MLTLMITGAVAADFVEKYQNSVVNLQVRITPRHPDDVVRELVRAESLLFEEARRFAGKDRNAEDQKRWRDLAGEVSRIQQLLSNLPKTVSTGTAFLVKDGSKLYLVTALHVVNDHVRAENRTLKACRRS